MLDYIIKVLLFQSLFLAVYDLVLKRETFFQWNRVYLISTSILAYIIPLLRIDRIEEVIPINYQEYMVYLPEVVLTPTRVIEEKFDWSTLLFTSLQWIFWIGLAFAGLLFLNKLYQIIQLIYKNDKENKGSYNLIFLTDKKAFSFFNYIFLGTDINCENKEQIIKHELVHVKQKHSLDLLFFELHRLVMWFNPFSYLYQKRIAELHEFIADSKSIRETEKSNYIRNILTQMFDSHKISFINPFFKHSLIKKRIVMLKRKKSKQYLKLKYLLLFPLIIVIVFFSANISSQEKSSNKEQNESYKQSFKLSLVKESPVYPGCEIFNSQFEVRNCLSESITNYFKNNFDFSLLKKIDKKTKRKHIIVLFNIDADGKIPLPYVVAPNKYLEKETLRVINQLPQMTPGIRKGESVGVSYHVSINFEDEEIIIKSGSGPY